MFWTNEDEIIAVLFYIIFFLVYFSEGNDTRSVVIHPQGSCLTSQEIRMMGELTLVQILQ